MADNMGQPSRCVHYLRVDDVHRPSEAEHPLVLLMDVRRIPVHRLLLPLHDQSGAHISSIFGCLLHRYAVHETVYVEGAARL